jgi:peroxiredoxin Q/BCP
MSHLKAGMKAPWFEGIDQNGNVVKMSDFTGKKIILYFYPKDDTPGCTAEACNLRDNYDPLLEKGFAVVGVSMDSEKSHKKFAQKYSLPFPLIADISKKLLDDYGVWGNKLIFGKSSLGIIRTTFVIDEQGIIEHVLEKIETKNHTSQILNLYYK